MGFSPQMDDDEESKLFHIMNPAKNIPTLFPQLIINRTPVPFATTEASESLTASQSARRVLERRDLTSLLRLVTWIFEPLAGRKQVTLRVDAPVTGLSAVCDEVRIQRVMEVLLTNAVNAAPTNSTILLSARQEGSRLRFSVEDEGSGVAVDEQGSVFDGDDNALIQFISPESGEDNDLAICRRIVAGHGGIISMHNRTKGGARYEFSIPSVSPSIALGQTHVA